MKIVIINGSHRKNGATALILHEMYMELKKHSDVELQMVNVADLELQYCVGCGSCYKNGACIYKDDIEKLSLSIADADGIILGSPTYASNVSAQLKVIIDRGHFVMEQLLYGKYAISVTTYENYGGRDAAKIINKVLSYSGAKICASIVVKNKFNKNPMEDIGVKKKVEKATASYYRNIVKGRRYRLQGMIHGIVFRVGIQPFVKRKGVEYEGVIKHWEKHLRKLS